jgi:hypothetical protein
MSDDINYMDLDEFREVGFLQEANRQFFHMLGLAIEVREGFKDRDEVQAWLHERGIHFGTDAVDCVWSFIVAAGLNKAHLGGVWDYRSDPEGMVFAPGVIEPAKASRVQAEREKHYPARRKLFNSSTQSMHH